MLKKSMARVSTELAEQLESSQENGLVAACRQKVLLSTIEASKAVEEQICRRSAATSHQSLKRLSGQQKKVAPAMLESDRARYRELQELVAGWQELIWGPGPVFSDLFFIKRRSRGSSVLVANPSAAAALHAAHLQAVGLVEDRKAPVMCLK